MSAADTLPALGPGLLDRLPAAVSRPAYGRCALRVGLAHIGVGAFHRCHQAEYTDDCLGGASGPWGVVGINIRPPGLGGSLGRQAGLYTRLIRENDRVEARVIGSIARVVDSIDDPAPALAVLAAPEIRAVTLTVTEKGYCHRPATAALDVDHPDIVHDLADPQRPRSLPGLVVEALDRRRRAHGTPVTLISCDNIPANGAVLAAVVGALAERRGDGLPAWIAANAAFPSTMVDRIAPATSRADFDTVERAFGYRDAAVVTGEPFRQWVIEQRFAGPLPPWDSVGAAYVADVRPFEHLKMRVLNGAQTTLAYLGVLAGHEHTCDDMRDPLLAAFVRRMLMEETLPTLAPVPGVPAEAYVETSLARLRNTAIRHRNHQIATDGSQKIVQRLLSPAAERLRRGQGFALLAVPVAAWMVYLIRASQRFGRAWTVEDPFATEVAAIADRVGDDPAALTAGILAIDAIFTRELAGSAPFRDAIVQNLAGLLGADPLAHVRQICAEGPAR